MAYLAWLIYHFEGNKTWLRGVYPKLKLHLWWQQQHPVFDLRTCDEVALGGEWGAYIPIDMRYLKFIASELGYEEDVREIDVNTTRFIQYVNKHLWNETAKMYAISNALDYLYGVANKSQREEMIEAMMKDIFPEGTKYFSKYADSAWKFLMPGSAYAITLFPPWYAKTFFERYVEGLYYLKAYSEGHTDIMNPRPAGTGPFNPVSAVVSWLVLMDAGFGKIEEGIYIRPYASSTIKNLVIRGSTLDMVTSGSGLHISKILIDGQELQSNVLHLFDRGYHTIEAYLGDAPTLPFLEIRYAAPVLEFASRRASYTASEDIDLRLSIYRGHGYPRTTTWLAKLTVKDSAGIIANTTSCDVGLGEGEITTLDFHLGRLKEGEYLAIVEIIDPQSGSVLTSSSLTFEVVSAIPAQLPRVTYTIVTLIVIGVTIVILANLIRYRKI